MPKLVIVESPTKAKTLTKILPKDYEIKASMGHIRDLPKSGLGVDVENNFAPEYIVPDKALKTLMDLKKSAKKADQIILATDPDREGEAISWHLFELLTTGKVERAKPSKRVKKNAPVVDAPAHTVDLSSKPIKPELFSRVVFHELTKDAIEEAFSHLGKVNMDLVDAQQARRVLDRLVGYKLSPLLWKKVRYGLSAGRVQSVAVRLIVERERERQAFKPEEYWTVAVDFCDAKGKRLFTADLSEKNEKKLEITTGAKAEKVKKELEADSFTISSIKKTERKKNPYPPFKTSTLQQGMANVFGFSAKRTMDAAQKLFEKGYITYHRTDSLNLSPQFVEAVRGFVKKEFGAKYLPASANIYKTKSANAQEAHEAIRPTDVKRFPQDEAEITPDEQKAYTLIWKRTVECQMEQAVYDQTSMTVVSGTGYGLKANGSIVKFDGWLKVGKFISVVEEDENGVEEVSKELPAYEESEKVKLQKIDPVQHFTQPPARFSDATLIKKMEELGVGRPSTYAPTIQTIQARGYVEKENRYFAPTDVSFVVIDLLTQHFPEIVDYGFTSEMELEFDEIADGKRKWVPVIREFYKPFEKNVKDKDKVLSKSEITNLGDLDEKCPECSKPLIFKLGRYGKFISCSNYPECKFAKPIEPKDEISSLVEDAAAKEPAKDYGKCDKCGEGDMIVKQGRFGKFIACSNYPKCKNTKAILNKIDMKCPKCVEGEVVVRFARKRRFFGCSRYPECDWSSWKVPEGANLKKDGEE